MRVWWTLLWKRRENVKEDLGCSLTLETYLLVSYLSSRGLESWEIWSAYIRYVSRSNRDRLEWSTILLISVEAWWWLVLYSKSPVLVWYSSMPSAGLEKHMARLGFSSENQLQTLTRFHSSFASSLTRRPTKTSQALMHHVPEVFFLFFSKKTGQSSDPTVGCWTRISLTAYHHPPTAISLASSGVCHISSISWISNPRRFKYLLQTCEHHEVREYKKLL